MRKAKLGALKIFVVMLFLAVCVWLYFFSSLRERIIVSSHRDIYHPVINEFLDGSVACYHSEDSLLDMYSPSRKEIHDNFLTLTYVNGDDTSGSCCPAYGMVRVISMDHKIVKAYALEGVLADVKYVFFDALDDRLEENYWESRKKVIFSRNN